MHARGSRRFWRTDRPPGAWRRLIRAALPVLLAGNLILAHSPAWALGPRPAAEPPTAAGDRALFPLRWSIPRSSAAAPAAARCEERLRSGGFADVQGWHMGASPRPARLAYPPLQATGPVMHLGIHPRDDHRAVLSYSSIWQEITLPADRIGTLRWSWQLHTEEKEAAAPGPDEDRQQILLLDAEGRLLEVIANTRTQQRTWSTQTHDLSPYAGQTVRLYFNAFNDGDVFVTAMWLDDISVQVCAAPSVHAGTATTGPLETVRLAWSPRLDIPPDTAGFLAWALGAGFSLLLVALGLWDRRQWTR